MISGDRWGLNFPDISLTVKEKPQKKPQPGKLTRPGIELGSARREATMLPLDHIGGHHGRDLVYFTFRKHMPSQR